MKFLGLLTFCILISSNIFAQEEVLNFHQEDGTSMRREKSGYSFSNELNGDLAIILKDRKTIICNLFKENFERKGNFTVDVWNKKYSNILGASIEDDRFYLLLSKPNLKDFVVQTLDFNSNTITEKVIDFDFEKEKFIEAIQYKNDVILISVTKENQLILRNFNGKKGISKIKSFDIIVSPKVKISSNKKSNRYEYFGGKESKFTTINNSLPNAIELTAQPFKLYQKNNEIIFTIENDDIKATVLHKLDLITLTIQTLIYKYPRGRKDEFKTFNSFVLENNVIQIGVNNEEMKLVFKSFDNTIVKEYYLEKNTAIDIKNSPIIQEGIHFGPSNLTREMEQTSKYLRKVTSGKVGMTAYKNGEEYKFSIGGYKDLPSNSGQIIGPTSSTSYSVYNPVWLSFNNSVTTKSTFFKTTFDKKFEYVKKEKEESNLFEKLREFKKEIRFETAEDIFIHLDKLYYGYYNTKEKYYSLLKIE